MMNVSFLILIFILPATCLSNRSCIIDDCSISINVFLSNKSCSELKISNGTFMLEENSTTNVITMSDFKIIGTGNTTIKCKPNAGLAFKNVSNIEIQNVTFNNCGMIFNSTSEDPNSANTTLISKAALLFEYCTDVSLTSVIVNGSDGIGVQIYNTVGNVNISHSIFSENKVKESNYISGGGGLYIEFSLCNPGTTDNSCKLPHSDFTTNAAYEVSFSQFIRNNGSTSDPEKTGNLQAGHHKHFAFGRGGGLSMHFMGNASCNALKIKNCTFKENTAQFGAGMFITFQDTCYNNLLSIEDTQFVSNKVITKKLNYIGTSGGGVMLDYVILNNKEETLSYNNAVFNNVTFKANAAFTGGGFSLHASKESNVSYPTNTLNFTGCRWLGNRARLGAAIDLRVLQLYENGQQLKPHFVNCNFTNNSVTGFTIDKRDYAYVIYDTNSTVISGGYWPGTGVMYLDAFTVDFVGNVTFADNIGGAVVGIDAGINVHQNASVNFINNHAESGGALYLVGYSWISLSQHVQMSFVSNLAREHGGAIYYQKISEHDLTSNGNCFIRYENEAVGPYYWDKVSLLFEDNCAGHGGDAIYTTTVVDCAWNGSFGSFGSDLQQVFLKWPSFKFASSKCDNSIQTSARYITETKDLRIAPGQNFKFPFKALDDFGNSTSATFLIYSSDGEVKIPNRVVQTGGMVLLKTSKINSSFYLQFETIDNRKHVGYITVTVKNCPLGFELNNDICECIATSESKSYEGLSSCEPTSLEVYVRPGYWAGNVHGFFSTYTCPFLYCIQSNHPIPISSSSDVLCKNRMGRLCGDCKHGYGLSVGTLECVKCTGTPFIAWIILIATTYIPITVVFVLVLVSNRNLAIGPIHSFIFFCQVFPAVSLDNNHWGDYSSAITTISNIHNVIINIMSLKFGSFFTTNYCLFPSMNAMDYYLLQYVSALYPLLILVIIVCTIKYCPNCVLAKCVRRMIKPCVNPIREIQETIVHGLIGFLLLTYANFVNISFQILKYAYFDDKSGKRSGVYVPFSQGTMQYFHKDHLPYALVAIVFLLIFGIIPPVILIFYPLILKVIGHFEWDDTSAVRTLRKWIPLYRLYNLFDPFWSELKPGCQEFAGLYFLYRLLAFSLFSFTPTVYQIYFGISILFIIVIFLHATVQPYRKGGYNKADIFMFAIIGIINSLYAHSEFLRAQNIARGTIKLCVWVQTILAWFPILYIICYIIFKIRRRRRNGYEQLPPQNSNNDGTLY